MARTPDHDAARVDAAFAHFARTGDPDALALVFDHVAPRLILIAAHLVDSSADAEDVLQTTFVEAIRNAHRFAPGKPVLPWLTAILARRAANVRRARGRRPVSTSGALDDAVDPAASPAADAAARETAERVGAAVDEMPAPFREVLTLHLLSGLRPIEIARALDRPVGTVHAQLHRGLARLRQALPPGVALAAAAMIGTRGPDAVRAEVMSVAREFAPSALTVITTGIIMKKAIVAVAALLAVVLAGTWYLPLYGASPDSDRITVDAISVSARAPDAAADDTATSRAPVEAPRKNAGGPQRAGLTGRVVAGETGAPLAGATVRVTGYDRRGQALSTAWSDPEPLTTGVDGRYRIDVALDERVGISFYVEAPGRVTVAGSWGDLRRGLTMDHGDVPLPLGTQLRARIVDENDAPVEGFELQFNADRQASRYRCGLSLWGVGSNNASDLHGAYPVRVVAPGRLTVTEDSIANYRFAGPWAFSIALGEVEREIVFRVRRVNPAHAISGRVVDAAGRPLPGMALGADVGRGWRVARTERDGHFAIGTFDPSHEPMRIGLMRERHYEILEPREPVAVGTRDLRVVVRPRAPARLSLEVVDSAGNPVERYAAVCMPCRHVSDKTRYHGAVTLVPMAHHAGGRVERELQPGSYLVFVRAAAPGLAPQLSYELEVADGQTPKLTIALAEYQSWTVRAVTASGHPVAGVRVGLRQQVGRGRPSRSGEYSLEDFLQRGPRGTYTTLVTAQGTTDADGRAELRSPADLGSAELELRGPHIGTARQAVGPRAPVDELRMVVESAAVVEGQLQPAGVALAWGPPAARRARFALLANGDHELRQRMPQVRLVDVHDDGRRTAAVRVDVDGSFRLESVPPGDWRVEFVFVAGSSSQHVAIGEILAVRGGQVRRETFDVDHLRPATLHGTASLDGAPVRHAKMVLRGGTSVTIDGDGRFTMARIPAGEFRPYLRLGLSPRTSTVLGDGLIRLRPGEQCEVHLSFTSHELRVTLRNAHGDPVAGRRLSLRERDEHPWYLGHIAAPHTTDARGLARFEHVPNRPVDVLLWHDDLPPTYYRLPDASRATVLGTIGKHVGRRTADVDFTLGRNTR